MKNNFYSYDLFVSNIISEGLNTYSFIFYASLSKKDFEKLFESNLLLFKVLI